MAKQHIAILGGGLTGLTAAYYLLRSGARVTVLESRADVGGLAASFDFGSFHWDKFYHCILTSDRPLLQLLDDLGLSSELRWQTTKVGFFAGNRLHSISTSMEFLRFPLLSLWDKLRFGLGIFYACSIRDGRKLESVPVSEWMIKVFGKANYKQMWGPLLKCKLGTCREEASASFIWSTITRLYSTREKDGSKQERLGYVHGGYRRVFERLQQAIEELGGEIVTGTQVNRVVRENNSLLVSCGEQVRKFDTVISTIPSTPLANVAPQLPADYVQKLTTVKYLGIVCYALVIKRQLSPFYVTNLVDEQLPFTGVIEMSNLVSREETAGRYLVYLPKYTAPGDPLFDADESVIWEQFRQGLMRVIPDFRDEDIEQRFLFRERYVQPVPVLHYSDLVPAMQTPVPGLLVANTTQIINSTLNNNAMVKIARAAVANALGQDQFDYSSVPAPAGDSKQPVPTL